ncbi:Patellin-4 [Folsomia candida]|uniref:Patellin-4 n=1 Tax=Folsomia candida TaxID=158441 RepID=A0A226EN82_FOLCA|nr:Patellin-4 [Folsomia candida]
MTAKVHNIFLVIVVIFATTSFSIPVEDDLTITAKEKYALEQFKPMMTPLMPHEYMQTDIYLIKWLRASKLNLKAAREMIISNLRWRETNRMDTILEEDFSEFENDFPASTTGTDYEGRPLSIIDSSSWDVRKAVVTGKGDQLMRYGYRLMETGVQRVYEAQRRHENVTQATTLMNMKGISLYVNFVLAFEHHYPGMAHRVVLINTPASFEIVLAAVRPVMSKETREALVIFGTNKQQWRRYILSMVPPDQLDHQFGGNKFD